MAEQICRIQNKLRQRVLDNEHREALLALYPDLRPATSWQERSPSEAQDVEAPDWVRLAPSAIGGVTGAGRETQSIEELDPPGFLGRTL